MSDPLHQTLMCTLKGKTLAYIVNVIPIMSERGAALSVASLRNTVVANTTPPFTPPPGLLQYHPTSRWAA